MVTVWMRFLTGINGVVVTWVVAIELKLDPPGVRFPLNAESFFVLLS